MIQTIVSENRHISLSLATRRELTDAIATRYQAAGRGQKKDLDEFIEVTSFHRKHAIRVLRKVPKAVRVNEFEIPGSIFY